ncbi:hypothetical protein NLN96_12060 [Citrobacter portucalensis]|uniref:hypothetical protein n=1 Tax=Citrobacter portucalensis TaxID=1639133 RepID=UPI00226BA8A1|nr:hypothetical protein [Citrobacter portucalensis]MCX9017738.1 hypothetical protein [Citrobacter portucalensis]
MCTKYLSLVAALIAMANGIIIASNDLVFGTRSGLPVVSAVIAVIFVALGFFVWRLGQLFWQLEREINTSSSTYSALSRLMVIAFTIVGLVMLCALYGLYSRILQDAAIFG